MEGCKGRQGYGKRFRLEWEKDLNALSKMGLWYLWNKYMNFDVVIDNMDYKNYHDN